MHFSYQWCRNAHGKNQRPPVRPYCSGIEWYDFLPKQHLDPKNPKKIAFYLQQSTSLPKIKIKMLRSCLSVDTGMVALPFDMVQGHCTFLDRMHTWCYDLVIVRFCYRSFISFLFSLVNYAKRFFFLQIGLFCWMPVKSVSHSLALAQNILGNNGRKLVSIWSSFYWLHVSFLSFIGYFLSCEERKKPAKKLNASNLLPIFVINFVILFSDMNVCLYKCTLFSRTNQNTEQ